MAYQNPLSVLFGLKFLLFKNSIRSLRKESRLKVAFISLFCFGLALAIYAAMHRSFVFVSQFPGFGEFLMSRMVYLFFFALGVMLTISAAITGYMTLLKSNVTEHLMILPVDYRDVWSVRFWDVWVMSTWASLFLALPLLVSYGQVRNAPWHFYFAGLFGLALFLVLAASAGTLFLMMAVKFLRIRKIKLWITIGAVIAVFLTIKSLHLFGDHARSGALEMVLLNKILSHTSFTQNPLWPSHWLATYLVEWIKGNYFSSCYSLCLLAVNALFFHQCAYLLGGRYFFDIWAERSSGAKKIIIHDKFYRWGENILAKFVSRPMSALAWKDIKTFIRDPVQWSQFLVFFGLLGIYIMNLKQMPYNIDSMFWKVVILFLNLMSTSLVLATLTTRFVYPLYSLEGRRFWIVGMTPISYRAIVLEKFVLSFTGVLFVTELLMILSGIMLQAPLGLSIIMIHTVLLISFVLVAMAVSVGVIFPNFHEENPSRIVSGFGGTLLLLISLIYIVGVVIFTMMPVYSYYVIGRGTKLTYLVWMGGTVLIDTVISIIIGAISLALGMRRLKNLEY